MHRPISSILLLLLLAALAAPAHAQPQSAHNGANPAAQPWPTIPRRIPPKGIDIDPLDRVKLQAGVKAIRNRIEQATQGQNQRALAEALPDVEIYVKAVEFALMHNEFYKPDDINKALKALRTANERLTHLTRGKQPWTKARGAVVRGYRSDIDGSVQPYGLYIPQDLVLADPAPLYVWLHGRGDKNTDLHFITQHESRVGPLQVEDGIVIYPFGRHCMGFKSAGEIDVLDAVKSLQPRYRIDPDRVALMGFSMGGAGVWHIGAHYPDQWAVMSPGAGFAETARYIRLKQEDYPAWYEQKLWHVYDTPSYVRNLFNLPVIAYSGEKDKQIQAAQVMEEAFAEHGRTLNHIIGPGMGHKYHPDSLKQIVEQVQQHMARGAGAAPAKVTLQTRTLRYNIVRWVMLLALDEHWQDTRVDAQLADQGLIRATTKNVAGLLLWDPRPEGAGFERGFVYEIDGQRLTVADDMPVRDYNVFIKEMGEDGQPRWAFDVKDTMLGDDAPLRKSPGLQGPIDDAFMAPFIVVTPSSQAAHPQVQKWVDFELQHFLARWRALYRGEPRVVSADELSPMAPAKYNLILFGDPASNPWIARALPKLPLQWDAEKITLAGKTHDAKTHVPVMIYPNPMAPGKYLVINSGPTHREAHDRTNSLQNPKLPDWAILNITTPPNAQAPGQVIDAAFFDEFWGPAPRRN